MAFQFLHAGIEHLLFNMIMLYVFGPLVEAEIGRRRYLAFYLLCGLAGPVGYMIVWATGLLNVGLSTPLIGASAGVYGIVVASVLIAPRDWVQLIFPPIPIQRWKLAVIGLVVALGVILFRGQNAGGEAAHLGGMAMAWLLWPRREWLAFADRLGRRKPYMRIRYD
jgi:membrane associated rhomboid family serine protease